MKTPLKKFFVPLAALAVLFAADNACLGAVTFAVTPAAISNTYSGIITLQVTGLNNNETVVVQKFLDANTNGTVDAGDFLVQQFNLTDGTNFVIGGVTNINVPGDTDTTTGQITSQLNFPGGDFVQAIIGKYLFRLSSPVGRFAPITDSFSVTNLPYAQKITGNVVNNGTNVPFAVVLLFPPPSGGDHGPNGNPLAAAVANNSGAYAVQVPPGTYVPLAFKSNFVANFGTSPVLTLNGSQTINTNLALDNATRSISGNVVDIGSGVGIPGLFFGNGSSDGYIATASTDTNGNFTERVNAGQWSLDGNPSALMVQGYVGYDGKTNIDTTGGDFSGLTLAFPKANALFYGSVKDNLGNPLPGIDINSSGGNMYSSDGYTDANGHYVVGVKDIGMSWNVSVSQDSSPANYLFSQGSYDFVGSGQAVRQDFTAILATNHITGHVQFNGTNVVGVQVDAYATIGTNSFQSQMDTDANGNYSLNVANGDWNVSLYQCCDNDSLDSILGNGNYQNPNSQDVNINNGNATNNFTIQPCNGVQIITTSLPDGTNGVNYYIQLQASSCNNNFTWSLNDQADFPPGLAFDPNGEIFNTPSGSGTYNFSVHVDDNNGHSADTNLSLYIAPAATPLQITTSSYLPNGTNTTFYSQTLQASGGTLPYSWAVADYSISAVPANLTLTTNGVLSGTLSTTTGSHSFDVQVTDGAATTVYQTLSVNVVNPPLPPLIITNTSLPNGNVGAAYSAQLGATGGQSPYYWTLATVSSPLPAGLSLNYNSGLISGTPTTNKPSTFKFQVQDQHGTVTNKVLSITINFNPVLVSQSWQTNRFQMRLTGAANQNYTLQLSTNLGSTNWIPLFITNNATTNSFLLTDPNATNKQRFYRVLIGP